MDEIRIAMQAASARAFELLKARGETVSFAESLTGGLIAATLIENPGASAVIGESYVTYSEAAKARILGVEWYTIEHDGVVSENCAWEMALGVRRISRGRANWGVSATGLAGPDGGTEDTPVGTVFIGVAGPNETQVRRCLFEGDRSQIRMQAVQAAFELLIECLKKDSLSKSSETECN